MHEISLRITALDNTKAKYRSYRPVGSVISAVSRWRKRDKWLEILCDLTSPSKRDNVWNRFVLNGYPVTVNMWNAACSVWSESLWNQWREYYSLPSLSIIERAAKIAAMSDLWTYYKSEAVGVVDEFGLEPHGIKNLVDTWLWSPKDKKDSFIIVNDDATYEDIENINGFNYLDGEIIPKTMFDWENDLGLSEDSKALIRDVNVTVNPRFDKLVEKTKAKNIDKPSKSKIK